MEAVQNAKKMLIGVALVKFVQLMAGVVQETQKKKKLVVVKSGYAKQYYQDHKQAIKTHSNKYYHENKEKYRAYYQKNKEKILQTAREKSKDVVREYNRTYYEKHKEKIQARRKETLNPEEQSKYFKQYREKNKQKLAEYRKTYGERVKGTPELREKKREYNKKYRDKTVTYVTCECGREILSSSMKLHLISNLHKNRLQRNSQQ